MAVFGESYSKFQSRQISVGTVIDLMHSVINPSWAETNVGQNQSVKTGARAFEKISEDFATFDVVCNVWKNAVPQTTMDTIIGYNHDTVYFMPHADQSLYVDEFGTSSPAEFYISRMIPFYVKNEPPILQDKLLITFESLVAVDPASIILV